MRQHHEKTNERWSRGVVRASMQSFLLVYRPRRLAHGAPIHGLGIREIRMQLANCRPRIRRWNSIERDAVATFLPGREGMGPARISGPRLPVAYCGGHKWGNVTIIEIHICMLLSSSFVFLSLEARDNNLRLNPSLLLQESYLRLHRILRAANAALSHSTHYYLLKISSITVAAYIMYKKFCLLK